MLVGGRHFSGSSGPARDAMPVIFGGSFACAVEHVGEAVQAVLPIALSDLPFAWPTMTTIARPEPGRSIQG